MEVESNNAPNNLHDYKFMWLILKNEIQFDNLDKQWQNNRRKGE